MSTPYWALKRGEKYLGPFGALVDERKYAFRFTDCAWTKRFAQRYRYNVVKVVKKKKLTYTGIRYAILQDGTFYGPDGTHVCLEEAILFKKCSTALRCRDCYVAGGKVVMVNLSVNT